jgi:acetyl esterase/lipase
MGARYAFAEPPTAYLADCRAARDAGELDGPAYARTLAPLLAGPVAALAPDAVRRFLPPLPVTADPEYPEEGALHIFDGRSDTERRTGPARAAALHLFGGGWSGGNPTLFFPQCRQLADRGAVAIAVGYRHYQPNVEGGLTPFDCVADCRAAVAHVRAHAAELGVDPSRVAVLGDSAGGHLSLMCGFEARGDGHAAAATPPAAGRHPMVADAVVAYNPVSDLATNVHGKAHVHGPDRLSISPNHRLRNRAAAVGQPCSQKTAGPELPPTLLVHGDLDGVCLVGQAREFAGLAEEAWPGRCEYIELEGVDHAFCYPNYTATPAVVAQSMAATERFLEDLGYLLAGASAPEPRL